MGPERLLMGKVAFIFAVLCFSVSLSYADGRLSPLGWSVAQIKTVINSVQDLTLQIQKLERLDQNTYKIELTDQNKVCRGRILTLGQVSSESAVPKFEVTRQERAACEPRRN